MEPDYAATADEEPFIRTVEEADPPMFVIDLGEHADHVKTDVIGETLIVVNEASDSQFEYQLPGAHRRTFMQNGVLTIEVEA